MTSQEALLEPKDPGRPGRDGVAIRDVIEAELRERILLGDIKPGGRINVRQLEQHFGVSHIPIREAIRSLEAEGLVVNVPKRGAVAADVSLRELDDIYDLRRIVEPPVVRRSVEAYGADDLAAIETAYQAMEMVGPDNTDTAFAQAHRDFHWQVIRPGCTGELEQLLRRLWRVADRYVRLARGTVVDLAHEQHHKLYDACVARDAAAASETLERHLHLTGDALRQRLHQLGMQ